MNRRSFIKMSAISSSLAACSTSSITGPEAATSSAIRNGYTPRKLERQPNIVVAVLDDVGFGDLGCYGSELETTGVDSLAKQGMRFNNFHVTALCAPTRACLLTGRNAHAVGVGNIAEWGRDHPGYRGWIRQDAATLAEILKPQGYTTLAIGKWHLSTLADQNATGPFDHWPIGRGFDRWYGFHGNAMDHFHPEMFENTVAAYPDKSDDYHLSDDLVNRAIHYVQDHQAATPDKPFFMYLAYGACHFPLHAPADDIAAKSGQYDAGYEHFREQRFARQKSMGIIPENTKLAPLNSNVSAWQKLTHDERKLVNKSQEVYAAFLEHTDTSLHRLMDSLKSQGIYDDTIVLVVSDNGAAAGGHVPSIDVRRTAYLGPESMDEKILQLDAIGTDDSYSGASRGWAQASNTPLKWNKADTHGGGTRAPLILSWPNGNLPQNAIADAYCHAIDVIPTLLDLINGQQPSKLHNQRVLPIQGHSFAHTVDNPAAETRKRIQYFETLGDRAIWADGWKAVAKHQAGDPFEKDQWELYQLSNDFSETNDLAKTQPEKLKHLINMWFLEAERYDILPMDDDTLKLYAAAVPKPRARYYFYPGMTRLDRLSAPDIFNYDSDWTIDLEVGSTRENGVILASGDSGAGYELYLLDGFLTLTYVYVRKDHVSVRSKMRIPPGKHRLGVHINKIAARAASVKFLLDDKTIATGELPRMWEIYTPNSGLRCGENRHAPISRNYTPPFVLEGLEQVRIDSLL